LLPVQIRKIDADCIVHARVETIQHLRDEYFAVLVIEEKAVRSAKASLVARVVDQDKPHLFVADQIDEVIAAQPRFFFFIGQRPDALVKGAGIQFIDGGCPPFRIGKCLEFLNCVSDRRESIRQLQDLIVEIVDPLGAVIFDFGKWLERVEGVLHAVRDELFPLGRGHFKDTQHQRQGD